MILPYTLYSRRVVWQAFERHRALKAYAPDPGPLTDADFQAVESWVDRPAVRQRKPFVCYYLRLILIFRFYEDEPSACLYPAPFPIESGTAPYG